MGSRQFIFSEKLILPFKKHTKDKISKFTCYFWLLGSSKTRRLERAKSMFAFFTNPLLCPGGNETELRMRINLNFTEAIMATEEDVSITDLAVEIAYQ